MTYIEVSPSVPSLPELIPSVIIIIIVVIIVVSNQRSLLRITAWIIQSSHVTPSITSRLGPLLRLIIVITPTTIVVAHFINISYQHSI